MRPGHVIVLVALLAPGAVAATLAAGQAAVVRNDGDHVACRGTAPVTVKDDGKRVYLAVGDASECTTFPTTWDKCNRGQGYRLSCRTPASSLTLTFANDLTVDAFVTRPGASTWHHLEGKLAAFG